MFRQINVGGKDVKFQCSAATQVLYKRLFGKSLPSEMGKLAEAGQKAQKMTEKLTALREEDNNEKVIELLAEDNSIMDLSAMTQEIVPQIAYIMWLEGNCQQRDVFQGLTQEGFVSWLTNWEPQDLINSSAEFFELWNGTNKTNSNLKNA